VKKIASVKNRIKNTPVSGAIPKRPLRGRFWGFGLEKWLVMQTTLKQLARALTCPQLCPHFLICNKPPSFPRLSVRKERGRSAEKRFAECKAFKGELAKVRSQTGVREGL
jgi:hypothetical protein